jgi:hypothetical protein
VEQVNTFLRTAEDIAKDFRAIADKLDRASVRADLEGAAYMAVASTYDLAGLVLGHPGWEIELNSYKQTFQANLNLNI